MSCDNCWGDQGDKPEGFYAILKVGIICNQMSTCYDVPKYIQYSLE